MKWFYRLKNKYRILIAVASYVPLLILCALLPQNEEITPLQTALGALFIALGIFFTVFAVKARKAEKPPKEKLKKASPAAPVARRPYFADNTIDIDGDTDDDEQEGFSVRVRNFRDVELPLNTKVVGVTFENRQDYLSESENDDEITVKHTPSEKYPEAMSVYNSRTKKMLGYIKAELAMDLLEEYGDGCVFTGHIAEVTGGDGRNYGCNIVIESEVGNGN